MIFQAPMQPEDPPILFESFTHGSLPACSIQTVATEDFSTIPNGTTLEGLGQAGVGACQWGTVWSTKNAMIYQGHVLFNASSSGEFGTRFISPLDGAGSLSFSARVLDLCRVINPTEPMDDLIGYCRALGKIITVNLCAFDSYCITLALPLTASNLSTVSATSKIRQFSISYFFRIFFENIFLIFFFFFDLVFNSLGILAALW